MIICLRRLTVSAIHITPGVQIRGSGRMQWMINTKISLREARWRNIVRRQADGRAGVAEFCRREGLALSTFHWWRRRLALRESEAIQWVEARAASVPSAVMAAPGAAGPAVRVCSPSGLSIEFASLPSADLLVSALLVLHSTHRNSC